MKSENLSIDEIREKVEMEKQEIVVPNTISSVDEQIKEEYDRQRQQLQKSDDFKNLSKEIIERSAKASLAKDMLEILNQEQKNQLSAYVLELEKEKLNFRRKREKKIVIEEVKSEIANRKIEALKVRYSYLYKENEPFIPNKSYNRQREIANWWNGTSDNFKRIVKGTLKFMFWGTVGALTVYFGYQGIRWLVENTNAVSQQINIV